MESISSNYCFEYFKCDSIAVAMRKLQELLTQSNIPPDLRSVTVPSVEIIHYLKTSLNKKKIEYLGSEISRLQEVLGVKDIRDAKASLQKTNKTDSNYEKLTRLTSCFDARRAVLSDDQVAILLKKYCLISAVSSMKLEHIAQNISRMRSSLPINDSKLLVCKFKEIAIFLNCWKFRPTGNTQNEEIKVVQAVLAKHNCSKVEELFDIYTNIVKIYRLFMNRGIPLNQLMSDINELENAIRLAYIHKASLDAPNNNSIDNNTPIVSSRYISPLTIRNTAKPSPSPRGPKTAQSTPSKVPNAIAGSSQQHINNNNTTNTINTTTSTTTNNNNHATKLFSLEDSDVLVLDPSSVNLLNNSAGDKQSKLMANTALTAAIAVAKHKAKDFERHIECFQEMKTRLLSQK